MKNQPAINQRYIYLIILFIAGVALWEAVKNLFFFDEDVFIIGSGGVFIQNLWQRSGIVKLTFIADNFLWGKNPAGYHYTNLILHLADAALALLVLRYLLKLMAMYINDFQQTAICYIFFILFLISPAHSEPLSYILARGGSVVTLFSLLSILLFLKSNCTSKLLLFFSSLSFLLALFSYEVSWTVPFIILSIIIFNAYVKRVSLKKNLWVVTPYFLIFALWFIVKIVVIDKMEISDYKDEDIFSIGFAAIIKNSSVLFLRNFIPPFKNGLAFLSAGVVLILALLTMLVKLYKNNRAVFYFSLLLIVITFLGFAATVIFGIDSHDSESERYIYFSSVFALMLVSVLIVVLIKNKLTMLCVVSVLFAFYSFSLFRTISGYKRAGDFSANYLQAVNKKINGTEAIFFVNMPSQYNGALLFRAKSRIANNTNDKVSVMQEYLSYLYRKNNVCITLSAKELDKVPERLLVLENPVDSISTYFPAVKFDRQNLKIGIGKGNDFSFENNKTIVVALKDSTLYFFK
jgi:hypothetical protein